MKKKIALAAVLVLLLAGICFAVYGHVGNAVLYSIDFDLIRVSVHVEFVLRHFYSFFIVYQLYFIRWFLIEKIFEDQGEGVAVNVSSPAFLRFFILILPGQSTIYWESAIAMAVYSSAEGAESSNASASAATAASFSVIVLIIREDYRVSWPAGSGACLPGTRGPW